MAQNHLNILHRKQAYLPVPQGNYGVFRAAELDWGAETVNAQRHNSFTMLRVLIDGCLDVESRSTQRMVSGAVIVHPAGVPYVQRVPAGEHCHMYMIAVQGVAFQQRWIDAFGHGAWCRQAANSEEIAALFHVIFLRATAADATAVSACQSLLAHVLDACRRVEPNRDQHSAREQALAALSTDLARRCTQDQLAQLAGVDRSTLHRWCTSAFGLAPHAYRQRCRLEAAAQQLVDTDDPIYLVANHFGFACPFAFSKAFKRYFGFSPSQCRNK